MERVIDNDYNYAHNDIYRTFSIRNLGDYHDSYAKSDNIL